MKKPILTICLAAAGLTVAAIGLHDRVDYQLTANALAETDTSAISAACTDETVTAFVPGLAYTITWTSPARGAAATPSATANLSNGINSDSNPTITATLNCTGCGAGEVVLTNQSSKKKLAGLQCQELADAKLEAHGDGTDNTKFDIGVSNIADSDTIWTAADQVDNATSGAKDVLFGTSGQIATSVLTDGSDNDSATNGEIDFGGASEAAGASQTAIKVDISDYDVQAGTDTETLTYTFTGS
jgi:hypothetical protein